MKKQLRRRRLTIAFLIVLVPLLAIITLKVSWAGNDDAPTKILLNREQVCLTTNRELAGTISAKLMEDAPFDFNDVSVTHSSLEICGNSADFLHTLYYLYSLAPESFRPTIRSVLLREIKETKTSNAENVRYTTSILGSMTNVPAALAVSHAKQCFEDYQKELDALNP